MAGYLYGLVTAGGVGYPGVTVYARTHKSACSVNNPTGGGGTLAGADTTNANGGYVIAVPTKAKYDIQVRYGPYHKTRCSVTVDHNKWVRISFTDPYYQDS